MSVLSVLIGLQLYGFWVSRIFTALIYRAHRAVIFAIAQISCNLNIPCNKLLYNLDLQLSKYRSVPYTWRQRTPLFFNRGSAESKGSASGIQGFRGTAGAQ